MSCAVGENMQQIDKQLKIILLVGYTRTGKDCFVNTLAGKTLAHEGAGNMDSTTKMSESYNITLGNEEYLVINMPGFNDTQLSFTNN
jgi:GTP-binding protein EngB required for normal cell division